MKQTFAQDTFATWTFATGNWAGAGEAPGRAVVKIEGHSVAFGSKGVMYADSTRTVTARITPGDAAVNYVFEETEVS